MEDANKNSVGEKLIASKIPAVGCMLSTCLGSRKKAVKAEISQHLETLRLNIPYFAKVDLFQKASLKTHLANWGPTSLFFFHPFKQRRSPIAFGTRDSGAWSWDAATGRR